MPTRALGAGVQHPQEKKSGDAHQYLEYLMTPPKKKKKNIYIYIYTPQKKVTQHDFDRLYFDYLGFLFIKLDILRKLVYLPFH